MISKIRPNENTVYQKPDVKLRTKENTAYQEHDTKLRTNANTAYQEIKLCDPKALAKYQCSLCTHLIRSPIQTRRGEIACENCYVKAKAERNDGICPIDGDKIEFAEFRDKGREREVSQLKCFCSNEGCDWARELLYLERHMQECEYTPVKCKLCYRTILRIHRTSHMEKCPKLLANGCIFKGCPYKPGTVENLKDHLRQDEILHAYLHSSTMIDMQEELTKQSSLNEKLMYERDEQRSEIEAIKLQMEEMSNLMKRQMENQNKDVRIGKLEDSVKKLEQNQNSNSNLNLNSSTNTQNEDVNRLSSEVNLMNKSVADVDLRLQLFENTCYGGKLLWKIDNVETRMNQAITGRVTALHSAPAYTDVNRYKFCSRLYLNGDGLGKAKYISLFFVLMKSDYDSLLSFPFAGKVSFKLINQSGGQHREESFAPEAESSSFARPIKEMNIAAGCPRFISLESFKKDGFIKNDCIYLELNVVSTNEIPLLS